MGLSEDFESGSVSSWDNKDSDFASQTDYAYNGTYSGGIAGGIEADLAGDLVDPDGVTRPQNFRCFFLETSSSFGGGIRLQDDAGNTQAAFASDNPQWYLQANDQKQNAKQIYGGDGYERWIKIRFDFSWLNSEFDYTIEDLQSGTIKTGTFSMLNNKGIARIRLELFNTVPAARWWYSENGKTDPCDFRFDDIQYPLNSAPNASLSLSQV